MSCPSSLARTASLLAVAAGPAAAQDDVDLLRLVSVDPSFTHVDLGPSGKSSGDVYTFDADITRNGKRVGRVYGSQISIKIEGRRETVSGQMTFRLRGGNTIVVGGLSAYPADDNSGFIVGKPVIRAVIGGTGRYTGARGTIVSTRLSNGKYRQVIHLLQ